jgi:Spy/CpxP family protein refolding chaperone
MHRKLCTYTLTTLLTLGIAAGTAFAQDDSAPPPSQTAPMPMRGHRRMDPEHQLKHMTKQLDLSADQQSQIKPILESRQEQMQSVWQDQTLSRQDRRQKMMAIQQDTTGKIEAVLNDTQKQKYEAMQAKMREHRMHRRGMGQGMDQGGAPPPDASSQPQQQ